MLTLTEWWTRFHEETRMVAALFPRVVYQDELARFDAVELQEVDSPWQTIHNMASLGVGIESNLSSGLSIGNKIQQASNVIRDLKITDEKSLLVKILSYRSQCRYKQIKSSSVFAQKMIESKQPQVD